MLATVKKWGNSYAIRLTKADLDRLGLKAGQGVDVTVVPLPHGKVDVSKVPKFRSGMTLDEARGDYAQARVARWSRARG